ncbi:MAG: MFS transporter [Clostridiales bacterium]|nr:MFS transporter [Clostridiales bacterium]
MNETLNPEKKILGWGKYEFSILWMFFLIWGLVFLDRLVLAFTAPMVIPDLGLAEVEFGWIMTATTGAYALASIFLTPVLEATGKRKRWLILMCLGAGIFACLGALTNNVWELLITRALVGLFEGPIAPLIFAMLFRESSAHRVALNAGIVNMGVGVVAFAIGAPLVTKIAADTGSWRNSFLLAGVVSIIVSLVLIAVLKEKPFLPEERKESMIVSLGKLLKYRNVVLCFILGILTMVLYWTQTNYATLYFTMVSDNPIESAGVIVGLSGALGFAWTVVVPKVSDYMGRKGALIMWFLLASLVPFIMYFMPGASAAMIMYLIFGGLVGSIIPFFQAIIPSETLPNYILGVASGLIIGISELVGGSLWQAVAGYIFATSGVPTVILIGGIVAVIAAILSFFLKETRGLKDEVQNMTL